MNDISLQVAAYVAVVTLLSVYFLLMPTKNGPEGEVRSLDHRSLGKNVDTRFKTTLPCTPVHPRTGVAIVFTKCDVSMTRFLELMRSAIESACTRRVRMGISAKHMPKSYLFKVS